jgi:hypothetical protein
VAYWYVRGSEASIAKGAHIFLRRDFTSLSSGYNNERIFTSCTRLTPILPRNGCVSVRVWSYTSSIAALTDEGIADRKMLFQHSGFLPTPKGSQTTVAITQNVQASAVPQFVAAPRPEETIRRLSDRFNEARGLPSIPAAVLLSIVGTRSRC